MDGVCVQYYMGSNYVVQTSISLYTPKTGLLLHICLSQGLYRCHDRYYHVHTDICSPYQHRQSGLWPMDGGIDVSSEMERDSQ